MKIFLLIALLIAVFSSSFSLEFSITGVSFLKQKDYWLYQDKTAVYNWNILNTLDGEMDTAYGFYFYPGIDRSFFFPLEKPIVVDEVRFINRCDTNRRMSYIHGLTLKAFTNGSDTNGHIVKKKVYQAFIELPSSQEEVTVYLSRAVKADSFEIQIDSAYTTTGGIVSNGSAALAEIGFYYQGEKYCITNLNTIREAYLSGFRQEHLKNLKEMLFNVRGFGFNLESDVITSWEKADIDTKTLARKQDNQFGYLPLEFTEDHEYSGRVLCGKKGFQLIKDAKNPDRYHFLDGMEIGSWKVDEEGTLWLKVGSLNWEKENQGVLTFGGTVPEGVRLIGGY